jgi:hypothetical protein
MRQKVATRRRGHPAAVEFSPPRVICELGTPDRGAHAVNRLMKVQRMIAIFAVAAIALFGVLMIAQGHSRGTYDASNDQHTRFDARDRRIVGEWYKEHETDTPVGFRPEDRLTANSDSGLRVGEVLDPDLRTAIRPVPADLLQRLPIPARGYIYAVLGGHLLLLEDKSWNVSDVLHFELDFGRP